MQSYKIVLRFENGKVVEGVKNLNKRVAEQRVSDFVRVYPEFEHKYFVKICIEEM